MPKLTAGQVMPNFSYDTSFQKDLTLEETVRQVKGKTAIVFLRYFGCTLCQLDLHSYAAEYGSITKNGGQFLVVLQSTAEGLAAQLQPEVFPFPIICDPEKRLYEQFGVGSAKSKIKMMSPSAVMKGVKAMANGHKHGDYEGDELQLPAVFVMDPDRRLNYVHYGRDVGDTPTAEQLASLLA